MNPLDMSNSLSSLFASSGVSIEHKHDVRSDDLLKVLPTALSGVLYKRGRLFSSFYHARFVALKGNVLEVHVGTDDVQPSLIRLAGYKVVVRPDVRCKHGTVIQLEHATRRSYFFAVPEEDTDPALSQWIEALTKATETTSIEDFRRIKRLGSGAFGDVFLVRHYSSGLHYALKRIAKNVRAEYHNGKIVRTFKEYERVEKETNRAQHTLSERNVMQRADHPNLVKLQYAFQDTKYWYMVMDLVPGGELYQVMIKQPTKKFSEDVVRVWAAELVSALEHLHDQGCVHRDIKPENIMVDAAGHLKLGDFGFAKYIAATNHTSNTFCGSKLYMPPEMLRNGHKHSYGVDYWALGVLLFELITGRPPFQHKSRSAVYRMILNTQPVFPADVSPEARSLISALMEKFPHNRIGVRYSEAAKAQGTTELRLHPFFKGINWDMVDQGRHVAPFEPTLMDVKKADPTLPPAFSPVRVDKGLSEEQSRNAMFLRLDGFSYRAGSVLMESVTETEESPTAAASCSATTLPGLTSADSARSLSDLDSVPPELRSRIKVLENGWQGKYEGPVCVISA